MKKCSKCKIVQNLDQFALFKEVGRNLRHCSHCKSCIKKKREILMQLGKCPKHPTETLRFNYKNCLKCKKYQINRRQRLFKQGLCYLCAKSPVFLNKRKCQECLNMNAWKDIKRNHGINKTEYMNLYSLQGGLCFICKKIKIPIIDCNKNKTSILVVDHDHKTKKIRSLLCFGCNVALGHVQENINTLHAMIEYIKLYTNE